MGITYRLLMAATLLASATLVAGCGAGTKQARSMEREGGGLLIKDHSVLQPGKDNEALWIYKDESADWASYDKIVIDQVKFAVAQDVSEEQMTDLQALANNLQTHLLQQLGMDFEIVERAGPGTLRVAMGFYNAEAKSSTAHVISSTIPFGLVASLTTDFITGEPLSVGEISAEALLTDSVSGDMLAAALDRRVGTQWGEGMTDAWAEANHSVEFWAKRMRFALCKVRGRDDCVAPTP